MFSELSKIFDPSTPSKLSEYDRLQQDLEKSVRENRHLSRQMEDWKRQLADSAAVDVDSELEGADADSPAALRLKQEQAYRSVGALQLRVEQLTLEVTKVSRGGMRNQF